MRPYLDLWLRAFLIVMATAANVSFISRGAWGWAFVTGWTISALWWKNSRSAARSELCWAGTAYALGAACGTMAGMGVARLL